MAWSKKIMGVVMVKVPLITGIHFNPWTPNCKRNVRGLIRLTLGHVSTTTEKQRRREAMTMTAS